MLSDYGQYVEDLMGSHNQQQYWNSKSNGSKERQEYIGLEFVDRLEAYLHSCAQQLTSSP